MSLMSSLDIKLCAFLKSFLSALEFKFLCSSAVCFFVDTIIRGSAREGNSRKCVSDKIYGFQSYCYFLHTWVNCQDLTNNSTCVYCIILIIYHVKFESYNWLMLYLTVVQQTASNCPDGLSHQNNLCTHCFLTLTGHTYLMLKKKCHKIT